MRYNQLNDHYVIPNQLMLYDFSALSVGNHTSEILYCENILKKNVLHRH